MGWKEEAAGIEPWPTAVKAVGDRFLEGEYGGCNIVTGESYIQRVERVIYVPDLDDPDTLAAFDRRLALRLGAPEEAAREGVVAGLCPYDEGSWFLTAGCDLTYPEGRTFGRWEHEKFVGTDDPLLARVRLWNSVNDKEIE